MACVYAHIRPDTDSVFYIGISKTKSRPYSKHNRNNYWKNIVAKCNGEFTVNILYKDLSWEEACKKK